MFRTRRLGRFGYSGGATEESGRLGGNFRGSLGLTGVYKLAVLNYHFPREGGLIMLVSCNECYGKVSEFATRCPHCGCEFDNSSYDYSPPPRAKQTPVTVIVGTFAAGVGSFLGLWALEHFLDVFGFGRAMGLNLERDYFPWLNIVVGVGFAIYGNLTLRRDL